MKKSNWIVFGVIAVVSAFLLWLWYLLGFDRIDNPLDLVLSIAWWAVVIICIAAIWRVEKARRERIRTFYINGREVFNSEAGRRPYSGSTQLVPMMANILDNLEYDFTRNEFPEQGRFPVKLLVRTIDYGDGTWAGEVVDTASKRRMPFGSREELSGLLAQREYEPR